MHTELFKVGAFSGRPASKRRHVVIHHFAIERVEDASLEPADGHGGQYWFPAWARDSPDDVWEVVGVMVGVVGFGEYWRGV